LPFGALTADLLPVFSIVTNPDVSCRMIHATTVRPVDSQRYATFSIITSF
jgi:transketolase C-terminal domain/subunit